MLSSNLNFTIPLLTAQGRNGWTVPFNLTYNSQDWRLDSGGTWDLGEDVGYGYGWRLSAGALTPYYIGAWGLDHYVFVDATGAEYRLNHNNNGIWSSIESLYVWYDSNANILHFRDGSFWVMGCTSGGTEPDAGTMYPTVIENTSGNQVLVNYYQGNTLTWTNSSARIQYIQDVRAVQRYGALATYTFLYTTDAVPHLTSVENQIGTSEAYQFAFAPTQALLAPFSGSPYNYSGGLTTLASMTAIGINMEYSFLYDQSGEMTQVTFPYGGYFKYNYGSVTYSSGFTQREVQSRIMSKDGTQASEVTYPFTHESNPSSQPVHQFTTLADPGGMGQKRWVFSQSGANIGLTTSYQGQQLPGPTTMLENDFTWNQDANGNFYIGSTLTTWNPGSSQVQTKTNQTVDVYGNVTQVQKYSFSSLSTPARTYNYSYLNSSAYLGLYIYNRLTSAAVTDGTNNLPLASNTYDYPYLTSVSGSPQEWDSTYANQTIRGNVYVATTPSGSSTYSYDTTGNVVRAVVNGVTTTVTTDSTTNFAAPTQLTTGSLNNSLTWTSFLGLGSATGANGDSVSTSYDTFARPTSTTSPFGAVTTYTYSAPPFSSLNPATVKMTTNSRWTLNTLDGFGRTIMVQTGDANGTQSQAESVYAPCACSPLGKLTQQALPHAVSATPTWTTYTYDGIGRTLSAATVGSDTRGTTTYSYTYASYGIYTTVVDPAGKYKYYVTDAFNNLLAVSEPPTSSEPNGASTYYYYDLLDHLTTVGMGRQEGTQTRSFVYSGNLLTSATNPENGTVTYTYNQYYKVATKTDAKGQQVVYTYDTLARLTKVQRYPQGIPNGEDTCQQENYAYDTYPPGSLYSQYALGRLTQVQYYGGSTTYGYTNGGPCDTTFTETYGYNQAGGKVGKSLVVSRNNISWTGDTNYPCSWYSPCNTTGTATGTLTATYTYDNEGRITAVQYPSWGYQSNQAGPNLGWAFDTMGRPNTMTDLAAQQAIISGATYNAASQLLSMTPGFSSPYPGGSPTGEGRTYNSMGQLTSVYAPWPNTESLTYAYPSTGNNGKISSQTDGVSGEQVVYTYDALNRLASATATSGSWGQSYSYDGFGNLTGQTVTTGSAPAYQTSYDPSTNHVWGMDANGNMPGYNYDVENRIKGPNVAESFEYSYAPGNKRVWRGVWTTDPNSGITSLTTDEVTFWSVTGQKLATYQIQVVTGNGSTAPALMMTQTGTNYYFGAKLIKNAGGYVVADRLGSIGKFYPWGQEKPSATTNGTEKFTGYFRDAETGLDYAVNRHHSPGTGRFMTPDPYMSSAGPTDPGGWNRYAYTRGDPVNRIDRTGLDDCSAYRDAYACPYALDTGGGGGDTCTLDPVTFVELCSSGDSCYGDDLFSSSSSCTGNSTPIASSGSSGSSDETCFDWGCMPAAYARAVSALTLNQDCMNLFGNANSRAHGWNPVSVLTDIVWGSHRHGNVTFANLGPDGGSAVTAPSGHGIGLITGKVTITINEYTNPGYVFWNAGNAAENAETLLHELAHAYTLLLGSGGFNGTRFISDASLDSLIQTDCFPNGLN